MSSDNDDYLISLIIPTYNRPHKLKKSINSIINQSLGWENIELIIVDDTSTDKKTQKIILEYHKKYPNNIKPIFLNKKSQNSYNKTKNNHEINKQSPLKYGPGKARNIGIDHATSKYIAFSDDDDFYLNNGLETLYNIIKKHNSDLVICNHYNNINGDKKPAIKKIKKDIINTQPLNNQQIFNKLSIINGGVCVAKIYNKKFLEKNNIKFIENIKYEDVPFYMNILKHNPKTSLFTQKIVYNHNIENHTLSSTHDLKAFSDMIKSTKQISKYYQKTNININSILSFMTSQLLLIFSNLNKKQKKENINQIYKLEKYLEKKSHFHTHLERKEADLLNQAIMKKKFKKAIIISNLYHLLYNNSFIKSSYKKFR